MKTNFHPSFITLALLALSTLNSQLSTALAQGTAFTYQGQLQNSGSPASGTYNLTFTLFNTNTTGVPIAGPVTNSAVKITNGLFTVLIDFGPGVFTGQSNWLEIGVESNGVSSFSTLAPRQELTPTPNAIYAESANTLSGTLSASQLTSIGNTNGGYLFNFFVGPSGNSTMSGSANTAIGDDALHNNLTGSGNAADGANALNNNTSGRYNTANGYAALQANTSGSFNTVNGGYALSDNSSGSGNTAYGYSALYYLGYTTGTGGSNNIALGFLAGSALYANESSNIDIGNMGVTGDNNTIRIGTPGVQTSTFMAGVINGDGGGLTNLNVSAAQLIGGNNNNVFVGPSGNTTTSGSDNTANGLHALGGNTSGSYNTADGILALSANTSGGSDTAVGDYALQANSTGNGNTAIGENALNNNRIGYLNTAIGEEALLNLGLNGAGGTNNIALGSFAGSALDANESGNIDIGNIGVAGDNNTIRIGTPGVQTSTFIAGVINGNGGGLANVWQTGGNSGTTAGVNYLGTADNQPLELHVNGSQRALRLEPNGSVTPNVIGGSGYNFITSGTYGSTIAGGGGNNGTGYTNSILANANFSAVGGGGQITIGSGAPFSVIAGGAYNTIQANAYGSVISGGAYNTNTSDYAIIAGGEYNVAGQYAFAAGDHAQALNNFSFVWGDGSATTTSTANNQFMARASGGFVFYTSSGSAGAQLAADATSWTALSDRNAKKNFQPVDTVALLDKLAAIPIQQWNYKWEKDSDVPNIGPMAQDFIHAFYPGRDDKGISTLEFDGVELAAIQGLNQKLNEKDAEIQELKSRLAALEKIVLNQKSN